MIFVDMFLWALVALLAVIAASHSRALLTSRLREGAVDFLHLIPRIFVGVVGSGYLAEALPHETIARWLGPESGTVGVALAVLGGTITPGGPVVGFSIAAAALKGGAGAPQVIAYVSAWALFAVQRVFMWELPVVPARFVWLRFAASLPLPFIAAGFAILLGRP
jgi:uncharacterized membrane protein YraQ (UPF0718 family)